MLSMGMGNYTYADCSLLPHVGAVLSVQGLRAVLRY